MNLVESKPKEWGIDTGATKYNCLDNELFIIFKPVKDGEKLIMKNSMLLLLKGKNSNTEDDL